MQDYRKLKVWHRAQDACVRIYRLTAEFPREERYGLSAQLRDAGVSVGANISEGSKRSTNADKARLWNVAQSSAAEIMSELDVAIRVGYPGREEATALADEYDQISAMLNTLIEQVRRNDKRPPA
jgi:four helix bundle protein